MLPFFLFILITSMGSLTFCTNPEIEEEEIRARSFITYLNKIESEEKSKDVLFKWNYFTNMTDVNLQKKIQNTAVRAEKNRKLYEELNTFDWKSFTNPILKRQFMLYHSKDIAVLSINEITAIEKLLDDMQKFYHNATICDFHDKNKCNLNLEDIQELISRSENENELKHVWTNWRFAVGHHVRHLFRDYVHLYNKTAHLNNFKSADEMWMFPYEEFEMKSMKNVFETLWDQVKPLYQQMHAYVRYKLLKKYGESVVTEEGPIPAHLLGYTWKNLMNDFKPFQNVSSQNLTANMKNQNYTINHMFRTAENFYVSLGLFPMVDTFWNKSIFEIPTDRKVSCHPNTWDFLDGKDYRVNMCAGVNGADFIKAHHYMGKIEYSMYYKDQPIPFKRGANPGFKESIGDVIALSLQSPKHLKLLQFTNFTDNKEFIINNLFEIALNKIPFLSYSYLVDKWRWNVFSGDISHDDYNCKWWDLREEIQGIEPPTVRNESFFDPGAEFHIMSNKPHIRHFVSIILQFQLYRALCEKAGQYDPSGSKPLHLCDIYESKEAGDALREIMKLGGSKPWNEILNLITGQRVMDTSPLLEYFHPLQKWLEKENRINEVHIGWQKSNKGEKIN